MNASRGPLNRVAKTCDSPGGVPSPWCLSLPSEKVRAGPMRRMRRLTSKGKMEEGTSEQ